MLKITGVSRRFGDVTALSEVSLDIRQGEFFALLGPSGCGKTTLLRILAGFEAPDSGTVTLDGDDLLGQAAHRRPVNLMFQSYALFPHMSVARNVAYGLERERLPRAEIRERVGEVLEKVGLAEMAGRRPQQLSGGQRQRVALARAIVKRPRLLLLDEPLSALDKKVRAEMQLELKRLQNEVGITFVVVTHDQEEAMSLADRIAVFNAGRVEQVDKPAALYERPRTPFVADFVGANNLFEGKVCAGGLESPELGVLPAVSELAAGTPALLAVRPEQLKLNSLKRAKRVKRLNGIKGLNSPEDVLRGKVADVSFYGGVSHVSVLVDGRQTPILVATQGTTQVQAGSSVALTWGAEDGVLIPQ
ncbi:spermidine/putrescine ABC transporter ATP-binding subunit [Streptosporangium album]|uniref:Spermidine/putrescine ABC transporter ATP-binding subunit n=1 Tax=Streptosporangium album TaxID=47479 RepID=A0A7W7RY17_9ACTN|nr:ABC transporter ATP-binding protein [Streptosporangium album]MBB4940330.1 spermidine/putrescine ABC transporter ATP-binding subunit [Streptosporangium album]